MANDVVTLTYGGRPLRVLRIGGDPWFVLNDVELLIGDRDLVRRASLLDSAEWSFILRSTIERDAKRAACSTIVTLSGLRKMLRWEFETPVMDRRATDLRTWLHANLVALLAAAEVQA